VHLGLDRHGPVAVALRDIKALHLHMPEHLLVIAFIGAEQSLEDFLGLLRKVALLDIFREDEVLRQTELSQEGHALLEGNQEERMVAELAGNAGGDIVVG
jgi:hypothetical protein